MAHRGQLPFSLPATFGCMEQVHLPTVSEVDKEGATEVFSLGMNKTYPNNKPDTKKIL
jgi:hypothetical protein